MGTDNKQQGKDTITNIKWWQVAIILLILTFALVGPRVIELFKTNNSSGCVTESNIIDIYEGYARLFTIMSMFFTGAVILFGFLVKKDMSSIKKEVHEDMKQKLDNAIDRYNNKYRKINTEVEGIKCKLDLISSHYQSGIKDSSPKESFPPRDARDDASEVDEEL